MINIIDKHTAKLVVEVGKGSKRKRKTKLVEYSGKRDLERQYRAFEDEAKQTPLTDITVENLLTSYINNRKIKGLKPTTERGYNIAKRRIISRFDGVLARDLTTYHLDEFISEMAEKYAPKTIANTVFLLNAAYDRAIKTHQLTYNPCSDVTLPERQKPDIKVFDNEQLALFMYALNEERLDYKVGYELCLLCGMRRSEVLGLKAEDVNTIFKYVRVTKTRHIVDGKEHIQTPKTKRSARTLALPQMLLDDITELIKEHHSKAYNHTDYLIQDGFGEPMNPSNFSSHLVRMEQRIGLPNVTVHGLRHTFATLLNAEGVDIAQISAELGHSNITTTLNTYTHVFGGTTASSRSIADKMNDKFGTLTALDEYEKTAEA